MLRYALFLLAAAAAWTEAAAAPASVAAEYDVQYNGLSVASLAERYDTQDGGYSLSSRSTPLGLFAIVKRLAVQFTSAGAVTPRGLRPMHFEGRRATGEIPEVVADFDWSAMRLTLTHDGKTETVALPQYAQDRLSVMYQFMFLAPREAGEVAVNVTNGRSVDRYVYAVEPDVGLDTAIGRLRTVHLVRKREQGDAQNEIWLAPDRAYVPVRMVIVERNGTRYEQQIRKLDVQP
jgi:hypothetical protein